MFLMMNPSVACVEHADRTLTRTGNFARRWQYGGQLVGNMHAYVDQNRFGLRDPDDPIGPGNDEAILAMAARSEIVVLAYGQPPSLSLRARAADVILMLRNAGAELRYLRLASGTPEHPLYLPGTLTPLVYP
jgi:hypothetical protein